MLHSEGNLDQMNLRKIITLTLVFAIIVATLILKARDPEHGHGHDHAHELAGVHALSEDRP